jgi:hypothetical protein
MDAVNAIDLAVAQDHRIKLTIVHVLGAFVVSVGGVDLRAESLAEALEKAARVIGVRSQVVTSDDA